VANAVFGCGQYRLAVADIVVADMVCGQSGRTPNTTGALMESKFISFQINVEGCL